MRSFQNKKCEFVKNRNKYLVYNMEMVMVQNKLKNGKSSQHWYSPHKGAITQLAWNV